MPIKEIVDPLLKGTKAQYLTGIAFLIIFSTIGFVYAEQTKTGDKLDAKVDNATLRLMIDQMNASLTLQQQQYEIHRREQVELSRHTDLQYAQARETLLELRADQTSLEREVEKTDNKILESLVDIQKQLAEIKGKIE